jgi:hypothetical protein
VVGQSLDPHPALGGARNDLCGSESAV